MKNRQKKKNQQKYISVPCDEAALLTMSQEEQAKAWKNYERFIEKNAYCKTYRELKARKKSGERKRLFYSFPMGNGMSNWMKRVANKARTERVTSVLAIQSMSDFGLNTTSSKVGE